jgi:glycosyltransferase involved in cell wall biosynthesis
MKICLVSQEYPPETAWGGIGTLTMGKAQYLARIGHEVHVLSRSAAKDCPDLRTESQDGVVVHRMQPPGADFRFYCRGTYELGYSWAVLRQLARLIQETSFDVIDFPEYGGEGLAYLMDRTVWNWVPVVVNIHGPIAMFAEHFGWPEKGGRYYRYASFAEEFCIHRADAVMSVSSSIADLTSQAYGYPREKIDVIHSGVRADLFTPAPNGRTEASRPTILFVGAITENKGVDVLLEAVIRLRSRYPDILLEIVSGKQQVEFMEEFNERIEHEAMHAHVKLLGYVDMNRLPALYRSAHVFCAPAEFEALGIVYLEAMACGCPVVASTSGGATECVLDGRTGMLVPRRDVSATAAALDRLLSDAPLRRRMGEAGRKHIESYFTIEKLAERVLAVYEKATAHSQGSPERRQDLR